MVGPFNKIDLWIVTDTQDATIISKFNSQSRALFYCFIQLGRMLLPQPAKIKLAFFITSSHPETDACCERLTGSICTPLGIVI